MAVVCIVKTDSNTLLVGYYLSQQEIPDHMWRAFLSDWLPTDMIPTNYIRLDRCLMTTNGKVETVALPSVFQEKRTVQEAPTAQKLVLLETLSYVLDTPR